MKQDQKISNGTSAASVARKPVPGFIPDLKSELGRRQLGEVAKLLPFLVVFHLCASVAISLLVDANIPSSVLHVWQFSAVAVACLLTLAAFIAQTQSRNAERMHLLLRAFPYLGVLLAFVWTVPLLVFSSFSPADTNVVALGIVITVLGIGVVTLLRVPATAILYTVVLAGIIAQSSFGTLPSHQIIACVVVLLFGLALTSIIILMHLDYIKRYETEFEVRRQSQIIKLLLNDFEHGTNDWLWETDRDGKIIYASHSIADVLGLDYESLPSQDFLQVLGSESSNLIKSIEARVEIPETILQFSVAGKIQYWSITGRPLLDDHQRFEGYRGVGRNVTHQHDAEIEIRGAKESAEQASAAKSQFLAVISHELRTPINAIVGFSEVLNSEHGQSLPEGSRKDYLNTILESSKHLQGLINDILDATRIERGTLQLVEQDNDAAELIEVALKICRDQASGAKVSIVAHILEDVTVVGDMTRLKQVILNLLTNAIKFSPQGGVVNVDMQRLKDGELIISVRDAGVGISAEDAVRVFEPFVQADGSITRRFGGMGLGLSIARRIARMHGGEVVLNGEVGLGTDARFTLPATRVTWPKAKQRNISKVAA